VTHSDNSLPVIDGAGLTESSTDSIDSTDSLDEIDEIDGIAVDTVVDSADPDFQHPAAETFDDMGLSPVMLRDIEALGFEKPMPIQQQAIPIALTGRDLVGCAQTGTGKSAAFMIPMIEAIRGHKPRLLKTRTGPACPRAMILGPTRELIQQLASQLDQLTTSTPMSHVVLVGGKRMYDQLQRLNKGVTWLLATPGRLIDHIERGTITLRALEYIVLDEADRMFDMGFAPQIRRVMRAAPVAGERQTMMFSATMPRELTKLAEEHLLDPVRVEVAPPNVTAEGVRHDVKILTRGSKMDFLLQLLDEHHDGGGGRVLIFTRRKMDADSVASVLRTHNVDCLRMHADRSQEQRERALSQFRAGSTEILVATDLASRGIDVENIVRVINYDFPQTVDDYIHRAGRTARAGAKGRATSVVEPQDLPLLREIEKKLGSQLPRHGSEDTGAPAPRPPRRGRR
jgi:ATP-dependent RNA helicase RhlE